MADNGDPNFQLALEWLVRLRDETATPEERREFEAWLAADPLNGEAFDRATGLWDRLGGAAPEIERAKRRRDLTRRGLIGLAVFAAVGPVAFYALDASGAFADLTSGVGERRVFVLADGSRIEIGAYTAVSTTFDAKMRAIVLHRGEVFLEVAPDTRPLVVTAGDVRVRALGTRFDVRYVGSEVDVTVAEHAVEVRTDSNVEVIVNAGQRVMAANGLVSTPSTVGADEIGAWRKDRIAFRDAPLRRVLKELERYQRGRIVLVEPAIGDIRVTVAFNTRDAGAALQAIADTLPIIVTRVGPVSFIYRR
ncbi:MAG: FecR domain-containing protein [Rhizobiaceae bacterium]